MTFRPLAVVYAFAILALTYVFKLLGVGEGIVMGSAFVVMVAALVHLQRTCPADCGRR